MKKKIKNGFTLVEILVAVSLFATVATVVAGLYLDAFRETKRGNSLNQIYEDSRFILQRIAQEIRDGMIDYDEYYNQNVVLANGASWLPAETWRRHYGQSYGRYYSSFFNTGTDEALGFDCNNVAQADGAVGTSERTAKRNKSDCKPLKKTIDRHTGENPFRGKYTNAAAENENAFCGNILYDNVADGTSSSLISSNKGICQGDFKPDLSVARAQNKLYLISKDGFQKTILAREKIGQVSNGAVTTDLFSLSMLRLTGSDLNNDGLAETFVCHEDFQCRGGNAYDVPGAGTEMAAPNCMNDTVAQATDLPRPDNEELETFSDSDSCDPPADGFSKDFIPISPFRVNIADLKFYIAPLEYSHYAFSEAAEQQQPRVTVVLTIEPNMNELNAMEDFEPITLVQTISPRVTVPIPAPLLVE